MVPFSKRNQNHEFYPFILCQYFRATWEVVHFETVFVAEDGGVEVVVEVFHDVFLEEDLIVLVHRPNGVVGALHLLEYDLLLLALLDAHPVGALPVRRDGRARRAVLLELC